MKDKIYKRARPKEGKHLRKEKITRRTRSNGEACVFRKDYFGKRYNILYEIEFLIFLKYAELSLFL